MLGVYLAGGFLNDKVVQVLVHWHVISSTNPFSLLALRATNADLLVASRQLFLALILLYGSYALLIIPIDWWYRR